MGCFLYFLYSIQRNSASRMALQFMDDHKGSGLAVMVDGRKVSCAMLKPAAVMRAVEQGLRP